MSISMLSLGTALVSLTAASSGDLMTVAATMQEAALTAGSEQSFTVTINLADGWSSSTAGIPKMFLQLDVPDSVELSGKKIEDFRALARNEFVAEPWERLVDPGTIDVGFTLTGTPNADDQIAVNVVGYLRKGEDGPARFARQRIILPVKSGADGTAGDAGTTNWSGAMAGLQVGDTADQFGLPRADGSLVQLKDYQGASNVIVTTYRAFW